MVDGIDKKFVKFISAKTKDFLKIQNSIQRIADLRVLNLYHCETLNHVREVFVRKDFQNFFKKCYLCLILIIEVEKKEFDMDEFFRIVTESISSQRSIIIQIHHENMFTTIVRGAESESFRLIRNKSFVTLTSMKTEFNFESLLLFLNRSHSNLLDKQPQSETTTNLFSLAIQQNDELSIRFLALFEFLEFTQQIT